METDRVLAQGEAFWYISKKSFQMTFRNNCTDSDNDGLPDWWEMKYFGNLNQTAAGDPDGDGWTNLEEYRCGANPLTSSIQDTNNALAFQVLTPMRD